MFYLTYFWNDTTKMILKKGGIAFLYLLAALAIWFGGGSLGVPELVRMVAIVGLLAAWPLLNWFEKRKLRASENEATARLKDVAAEGEAPSEILQKAKETVEWLRDAKSGDKNAMYEQPWFIVAGPKMSGKSTLLRAADLDFQVLPNQRPEDLFETRATKNCDWLVNDWGVFLDTAGRYQSAGLGKREWQQVFDVLADVRPKRALDGFVFTVDVTTLLNRSETELEQEAKMLRARLDDFSARISYQFPVYLMFTGMDHIAGFTEFFSNYGSGDRSQVWGATLKLEHAQTAYALFDKEFDYLYEALMQRRLLRLSSAENPQEQMLIFDFPLRFYEIRPKLSLFANALFRPNPYRKTPLFRGFYFSSSASQTKPSVVKGETHQEASEMAASLTSQALERPAQAVGTGFFCEDVFKEVLYRDKDLAAVFQGTRTMPKYLRPALIASAMVCSLFFLAAFGTSFVINAKMIDDVTERAARVNQVVRERQNAEADQDRETQQRIELEALEALRTELAQLDQYADQALAARFGLYTGDKIAQLGRLTYFDALEQQFARTVFLKTEQTLREQLTPKNETGDKASSGQFDEERLSRLYDQLKTYLMLAQPEQAKAAFLANQLNGPWQETVTPDQVLLAQKQLEFFARHAQRFEVPHLKADAKLVGEARRRLASYPAVNRYYKRIISEIDAKVPAQTVEKMLAGRGNDVLQGTYAVPGSFTIEGYRQYVQDGLDTAALELSKTDWVMGDQNTDIRGLGAESEKLRQMYFREYTSQWQRFLKGVQVRPFQSREEAIDALSKLTDPESPMVILMTEMARQVQPSNIGFGGIVNWVKKLVVTDKKVTTTELERDFAPLILFTSDKQTGAATNGSYVSQYRAALRIVLDNLQTSSDDQLTRASRTLLTGKDELGLQKAELALNKLTETFGSDSGKLVANVLRQPLRNVKALVYGTNSSDIEQTWKTQILPTAKRVQNGFPFTDGGSASISDVAAFLNPQDGVFIQFYKEKLAASFEESQGQLKLKETGAFRFTPEFVAYVNNLKHLQEALFPAGGRTPEVSYEITLAPLKGGKIRLEADGNQLEVQGTTAQAAKFIWPARPGATSGARILTGTSNQNVQELAQAGDWGIFKLFGAGRPVQTADNQFTLTWTVGTATIGGQLRPAGANNPFQRSVFTQLQPPNEIFAK
ncbi:MAG: type VI secretion system membrane subunit TssM [Blastocatellia bacterium]|nr:type VI secretion system membrane subunit TssM [Blastocatellia bacterium]